MDGNLPIGRRSVTDEVERTEYLANAIVSNDNHIEEKKFGLLLYTNHRIKFIWIKDIKV